MMMPDIPSNEKLFLPLVSHEETTISRFLFGRFLLAQAVNVLLQRPWHLLPALQQLILSLRGRELLVRRHLDPVGDRLHEAILPPAAEEALEAILHLEVEVISAEDSVAAEEDLPVEEQIWAPDSVEVVKVIPPSGRLA